MKSAYCPLGKQREMLSENDASCLGSDVTYGERAFPDSLQTSDRMDLGQTVVDKTKYSIPLIIPEVFSDGGPLIFILERFGDAEVGYRSRDGKRKGNRFHPFSIESHFVGLWVIITLSRSVVGPGKTTDGVVVSSNGEELHRVHEGLQYLLFVVSCGSAN